MIAALLLTFAAAPAPSVDLAQDVAQLASPVAAVAAAAAERLAAAGAEAAPLVLASFATSSADERARRAWILRRTGGAAEIGAALELVRDPDARVRRELAAFLSGAVLSQARVDERAAALLDLAARDEEPGVRAAALEALASIDAEPARAALDAFVATSAGSERTLALELLARAPHTQARVAEHLARELASASPSRALDTLVASRVRALADARAPLAEVERAWIVRAVRHVDRAVRIAATEALEGAVGRLAARGDVELARAWLDALAAAGFEAVFVAETRLRLALASGDGATAREVARALSARFAPDASVRARLRAGRAAELEALAAAASGADPREALERARLLAQGVSSERLDLARTSESALAADALELEARVELLAAADELARTPARPEAATFERLRRAHQLALEAQLAAARAGSSGVRGLDGFFGGPTGLFDAWLDIQKHRSLGEERARALQIAFARALASVAPDEVIGFEPWPDLEARWSDPRADPARRDVLVALLDAEISSLRERLSKLYERALRAALEDGGAAGELRVDIAEAQARLARSVRSRDEVDAGDLASLEELRVPSSLALWIGRGLRDGGRAAEARAILERARDWLETARSAQVFLWGLEMRADVEAAIGSTYTDDGEPLRAEAELSKAVERLEVLEERVREVAPFAAAGVRNQLCSALVSLAVNANVKQRDPAKAVRYFERAFALRQDEFMRCLLACYRARVGRAEEARTLLATVQPSPATYYNLACTWALLGEHEKALEFLRLELEEQAGQPGALERQRAWARTDPDLESLRGDARFEALVGGR